MNEKYKFSLKPLPYGYSDLEPYLSEQSMKVHHTRHLASYIISLNKRIEKSPEYKGLTLTEIYEKAENESGKAAEDMRFFRSFSIIFDIFSMLLRFSELKTIISSTRFRNSGRNVWRRADSIRSREAAFSARSDSAEEANPSRLVLFVDAPIFEVIMITVFEKSICRP